MLGSSPFVGTTSMNKRRLGANDSPWTVARVRVAMTVALFAITLTRLDALVGHSKEVHVVVLGVFTLVILWCFPHRVRHASRPMAAFLSAYLLLLFICLVRGSRADVYNKLSSVFLEGTLYIAIVTFAVLLLTTAATRAERDRRLVCVVLSPVVYVAVNLLLHFGGVHARSVASAATAGQATAASELGTPDQTLSLLGIHTGRVLFPFANSINYFGIISSVGMVGAAVLATRSPQFPRRWLILGALICFAGVLLTDSRGPLVTGLVVIAYFVISKRQALVQWVAALLPVMPVILVGGLHLLNSLGVASVFSRNAYGTSGTNGGGGSFASATGRTEFWSDAWHVLRHFSPEELVGWGANGHITSGASQLWAYSFRGLLVNPVTANVHDLPIQTIFDTGLIGLLVLVATIFAALRIFAIDTRADERSPVRALRAMLITLVVTGVSEASPTYLAPEALVGMLLVLGAAAGVRMNTRERHLS